MGRRKLEDLLEGGFASRVYVAAFPCFRSSYQIAKMVVSGSAANASGRILNLAKRLPQYFTVKAEHISEFRMRALIKSNTQPLFSKLEKICQLDLNEANTLKALESNFRKIVGAYLELALKRDPCYLTHDIKASKELTDVLCIALHLAMLHESMQPSTLNAMRGAMQNALPGSSELVELAADLAKTAPKQTIVKLYTKMREAATPIETLLLMLLQSTLHRV